MPFAPKRCADSTAAPHRTAKRDALDQLHADALGDQLRVDLRLVDLEDVDEHVAVGLLLDLVLEPVDLEPLRPMMMPGREVRMLTLSLFAARSISIAETPACPSRFLRLSRSFEVLVKQLGVLLLGVPTRPPGLVEPEPKTVGMYLLAHSSPPAYARPFGTSRSKVT